MADPSVQDVLASPEFQKADRPVQIGLMKKYFGEQTRGFSDDAIGGLIDKYGAGKLPGASIRGVSPLEHYANAAADVLPTVGGALGGVVGGTLGGFAEPLGGEIPGMLAGSGVGGSLGRIGQRAIKSAVAPSGVPAMPQPSILGGVWDAAKAGLEQMRDTGIGVAGGKGVSGILERMFPAANIPAGTVAGTKIPGKDVGELAEKGLISGPEAAKRTTIQRVTDYSMMGNRIAANARQQGTEAAAKYADELASSIAPATDPRTSGLQIRTALEQARTNYKALGNQYWQKDLPALGKTVTVDMSPLVKDAKGVSQAIPETLMTRRPAPLSQEMSEEDFARLPESVRQVLAPAQGKPLPQESGASQLISNMQRLKPEMTATDAMEVKRYLDRFLPDGDFATNDTQGLAKRFSHIYYDQMEKAADEQGGPFKEAWQRARNFWGNGMDTFDSTLVKNLLNKNPEGYVQSIGDGDVTDINRVKQALFGQVERPVRPELREQAQNAWDTFRRQYIQTRLLQDPENIHSDVFPDLKARLNAAGPDQLKAVFGTDAKGREVLSNLKTLAEAMSRQNKTLGGVGVHPWVRLGETASVVGAVVSGHPAGALTPVGVETILPAIAKVMYSKAATKMMVHGLELSGQKWPQGGQIMLRALSQAAVSIGGTPPMPQPEAEQ